MFIYMWAGRRPSDTLEQDQNDRSTIARRIGRQVDQTEES